eukprot:COSAG01_NODE_348_length_18498_cov_181.563128_17_plen_94_part_00
MSFPLEQQSRLQRWLLEMLLAPAPHSSEHAATVALTAWARLMHVADLALGARPLPSACIFHLVMLDWTLSLRTPIRSCPAQRAVSVICVACFD